MIKKVLQDTISYIEFATILKSLVFDNHQIELKNNEIHFTHKDKHYYISKYNGWSLFLELKDEYNLPLYKEIKKLGKSYRNLAEEVNEFMEEIS
jgi:hypothetical protein